MTLFALLWPVYLLGNFHCIGMCGPLVAMIGKHQFRYWYFSGRVLSFSLAALIAAGIGSIINISLHSVHLSAGLSLFLGFCFVIFGSMELLKIPISLPLPQFLQKYNKQAVQLLMTDKPWHTFMFGFMTVALPCGQTLLVFSACALSNSLLEGFMNGMAFALLTTPSLFMAMHAHSLLASCRQYYHTILGVCAMLVGIITLCRGLADIGWIDHLVLWQKYHIVIY